MRSSWLVRAALALCVAATSGCERAFSPRAKAVDPVASVPTMPVMDVLDVASLFTETRFRSNPQSTCHLGGIVAGSAPSVLTHERRMVAVELPDLSIVRLDVWTRPPGPAIFVRQWHGLRGVRLYHEKAGQPVSELRFVVNRSDYVGPEVLLDDARVATQLSQLSELVAELPCAQGRARPVNTAGRIPTGDKPKSGVYAWMLEWPPRPVRR